MKIRVDSWLKHYTPREHDKDAEGVIAMRIFRMIYASRRTGRHEVAPTASAVGTGYVLHGLYVVLPRADTEIGPYGRWTAIC